MELSTSAPRCLTWRRCGRRPAASPARRGYSGSTGCACPPGGWGRTCTSPTAPRPGCTGRRSPTGAPRWTRACSSWSSGCAVCAARGTPRSAGRACSTPRCSRVSPGSPPSCGSPTTTRAATVACTSGTTRGWPRTTRGRCGGCSPWCRCRARSTTWCCPGCAATRCSTSRTCCGGDDAWWRLVDVDVTAADILVAGAGPAGLALALQAHDHGAAVRVVDRRPEAARPSRALILHARTLEVLRPLGVTQALLARADTAPAADLRLGARVVRVTFGESRAAGHRLPAPDAGPADGRGAGAGRGAGRARGSR